MFCILFQGCKNEPKEQLENKIYLIPEVSDDSIIIFGSETLDPDFIDFYKVAKVISINKLQISKVENIIKDNILNYAKNNDTLIYNRIINLNIIKFKRQYISFLDVEGKKY